MFIEVLALLFIILGGMCFGMHCSERLKRNVEICRETERLLRICEHYIRGSDADIYRIFERLRAEQFEHLSFLSSLSVRYDAECDIRREWRNAVSHCGHIADEERRLLLEFGALLGTSDTEGQLKALSVQQEEIHELYEIRCSEYRTKGKMYRSVGLLAGVTVGIIVI